MCGSYPRTDEEQTVRMLGKPVLYLRGLHDNLASERCWRDLARVRPDARIVRIQGPHMLLQVSPEECWKAILKFVQDALPNVRENGWSTDNDERAR